MATKNTFFSFVGYRGSGKSFLSRSLIAHFNRVKKKKYSLIDFFRINMDETLIERMKCSIGEAVKDKGWEYFREKETKLLQEIFFTPQYFSKKNDSSIYTKIHNVFLIDCGGGIVLSPENRDLLKRHSHVVFLDVPTKLLIDRQLRNPRPVLEKIFLEKNQTPSEVIEKETIQSLSDRLPFYREVQDLTVKQQESETFLIVSKYIEETIGKLKVVGESIDE